MILTLLTHENVDIIYIPNPRSMYDEDHTAKIVVGGVAEGLETNHRPTFFEGVALIVTKLLNRIQPDYAIFGEKDTQIPVSKSIALYKAYLQKAGNEDVTIELFPDADHMIQVEGYFAPGYYEKVNSWLVMRRELLTTRRG